MVKVLCGVLIRLFPASRRDAGLYELPEVITLLIRDARIDGGPTMAAVVACREVGMLGLLVVHAWADRLRDRVGRFSTRQRRRLAPDLRVALLLARRDPARSLAAVLIVAAVAGTVAAVVPIANGLRAPSNAGLPDADRLSWIWGDRPWEPTSSPLVSDLHLAHVRDRAEAFEEAAGLWMVSGRVTTAREPVHADVARVSSNFFDVVGAEAGLGRLFVDGEDVRGAPWVAVLTHDFWMRYFDGDPDVLGRTIVVGVPEMTVVGVLDEGFDFSIPGALGPYGTPGVWLPARHNFEGGTLPNDVQAILALRADEAEEEEAVRELDSLSEELDGAVYGSRGFRYRLEPLDQTGSPELAVAAGAVMGAAGLLAAVASVLLALLGASASSERHHAFRLVGVLGGGGGRALLHTWQAGMLGAAGAVLGLALALLLVRWLGGGSSGSPWLLSGLGATAVSFLTATYAAAATLHDRAVSGRGRPPRSVGRTSARVLVAVQVSGALVVLAGAALLEGRLRELRDLGGGLVPDERIAFTLYPMPDDYPDGPSRERFFDDVSERLVAHRGIDHVAATSALPLSGGSTQVPASRRRPPSNVDPDAFSVAEWTGFDGALISGEVAGTRWIDLNVARPGFFGDDVVSLSEGRGFEVGDSLGARRTVVISTDLEAALWPEQRAMGDSLWVVGAWREVIGIVEPIALHGMLRSGEQAWVPHAQVLAGRMSMVVSTSMTPSEVGAVASDVVGHIDPSVPVGSPESVASMLAAQSRDARVVSRLTFALALVALLLAIAAIQALVAGIVTARRREVVLRLVLGGRRRAISWLLLREGLGPIVVGVVAGIALYGAGEGALDPLAVVGGGTPRASMWLLVIGGALAVGVVAAAIPVLGLGRASPSEVLNGR